MYRTRRAFKCGLESVLCCYCLVNCSIDSFPRMLHWCSAACSIWKLHNSWLSVRTFTPSPHKNTTGAVQIEHPLVSRFWFKSRVVPGEDIVFLATDINLPGAVDWVMMQSCFGHHFMLVLEKQEKYDGLQQFYAIVQLIGTRKQAENFAYR